MIHRRSTPSLSQPRSYLNSKRRTLRRETLLRRACPRRCPIPLRDRQRPARAQLRRRAAPHPPQKRRSHSRSRRTSSAALERTSRAGVGAGCFRIHRSVFLGEERADARHGRGGLLLAFSTLVAQFTAESKHPCCFAVQLIGAGAQNCRTDHCSQGSQCGAHE